MVFFLFKELFRLASRSVKLYKPKVYVQLGRSEKKLSNPYYAILRSIPHKAGGIVAMGGSILVLLTIPFLNTSNVRNTTYRPIFKFCFWFFLADFVILTWVGQKPVRDSFILLGQIATLYYFMFFLILIPVVGTIESKLVYYKF